MYRNTQNAMRAPKLPTIILWDLDQTMIGDSSCMLALWNLYTFIDFLQRTKEMQQHMRMTRNTTHKLALKYMEDVPDFIRPHLKASLETLKQVLPNCEFFVYSAGGSEYVKMLIDFLEKQMGAGIAFRRPIFTRDDITNTSDQYFKSIDFKFETIVDALVSDYPDLRAPEHQKFVLDNCTLFIDDNDVLWDNKDKWIQCPKYSYNHVVDLAGVLPKAVLAEPKLHEYLVKQKEFVVETGGTAEAPISSDEKRILYHVNMAKMYQTVFETNNAARKDDFLVRFTKAVKAICANRKKPFSAEKVSKLRSALTKA